MEGKESMSSLDTEPTSLALETEMCGEYCKMTYGSLTVCLHETKGRALDGLCSLRPGDACIHLGARKDRDPLKKAPSELSIVADDESYECPYAELVWSSPVPPDDIADQYLDLIKGKTVVHLGCYTGLTRGPCFALLALHRHGCPLELALQTLRKYRFVIVSEAHLEWARNAVTRRTAPPLPKQRSFYSKLKSKAAPRAFGLFK